MVHSIHPKTDKEVDIAVQNAKKSLRDWSLFPLENRVDLLKKFQRRLTEEKQYFAEAISEETGKLLWDSLGEVGAMISKVDISIKAQELRCPERKNPLLSGNSITRHKPLGVLAVFGPFNFPGHLPNGHIVPALLAGNTVVFKPSELAPLVSQKLVNLWEQSGLPPGVLNLVQGGPDTGKALAQHPDINGLLFTGSWKTGKKLSEYFGNHPEKLLALEMGGNNPLVIGDISNPQAAAYLTIQSAYITAGQRCTCARRLIVPEGKKEDLFLEELTKMIPLIRTGSYTDTPEPFLGPVISNDAAQHLLSIQESLIEQGAIPHIKMKRLREDIPLLSPALLDVTPIKNRLDTECFGPLLQLIRVPDFPSAIEEANRTEYGLAAAIFTDNKKQYEEFFHRCHAGVINWNAQTTGASSNAPFGGVGKSGNYRPSAFYAADYCNYPVASIEQENLSLPETLSPGIPIERK